MEDWLRHRHLSGVSVAIFTESRIRRLALVILGASLTMSGCSDPERPALGPADDDREAGPTIEQGTETDPPDGSTRAPSIEVDGIVGADGRTVVSGEEFQAGQQLIVVQCVEGASQLPIAQGCDMRGDRPTIEVAQDGAFEIELVVRPHIGVGVRREVDCLTVQCVVGVGSSDDLSIQFEARVAFSAEFPTLEVPTLNVHASEYDGIQANADVTGSGFLPGSTVRLSQCPLGPDPRSVDAEDCLYDYGVVLKVDQAGSMSTTMVVFSLFQRSDGETINCVETPTICVVAEPFPEDGNRMTIAEIG